MPRNLLALSLFLVLCTAWCAAPALATHTVANTPQLALQRFLILPLTGQRISAVSTTALFHTLFNDFATEADGTTYVQTGDIPAMWLRDSKAQAVPYIRFQRFFPVLRAKFVGVIERDARNILVDPYANAFTQDYRVWERKWEIDSLASEAALAYAYWLETGDHTVFTPKLHAALRAIVATYKCEQHHATCSNYRYDRDVSTSYNYAGNTGMIWSAFRPSDDAVGYRYNIPQQMDAVVAMSQVSVLAREGYGDSALAVDALGLGLLVDAGIQKYGRYYDFRYGWMYVYETDGEGHNLLMDDANVPDLLAMPFFGYRSSTDPLYLNTRRFALSRDNPYYYQGRFAMGLGSPHTPPGWVWPLGIITRALTATTASETSEGITILAQTDSKEYLIHESFDPNAYWRFTRAEFGWANAFYAELIFRSIAGYPAMQFNPPDGITNLEPVSQTPTLTNPIIQLENQGRLVGALGDLLHQIH